MCLLVYAMYPVVNHEAIVQNTRVVAATLKYLKQESFMWVFKFHVFTFN